MSEAGVEGTIRIKTRAKLTVHAPFFGRPRFFIVPTDRDSYTRAQMRVAVFDGHTMTTFKQVPDRWIVFSTTDKKLIQLWIHFFITKTAHDHLELADETHRVNESV